jgi:hypothetical protein
MASLMSSAAGGRRLGALAALTLAVMPASAHAAITLGAAGNFTILGLANQTCAGCQTASVTINSATSIVGNVGYSAGEVSHTNQKVDLFTGTAFVSGTADFLSTPATFQPSGGVKVGAANPGIAPFATVDGLLAQANIDALAASSAAGALAPTVAPLGALTTDLTINSTGAVNVISLSSLSYNSNTLTLDSRAGQDDYFIFNISGAGDHVFDFFQSVVSFGGTGTTADHVLFNFTGGSYSALTGINLSKAENVFNGTILAPFGDIEYHNPATFNGALIGYQIYVHSDFNINQVPFTPTGGIPEPATWALMISGFGLTGAALRRRRATIAA